MKCVLLAGGFGTRLSEETVIKPKPMVEIGGKPILWHIMKSYLSHGVDEFIICLGYKGHMIKEYFSNYGLHNSSLTIDFKTGTTEIHKAVTEPWKVTLVDTGDDTMTGGRIKRVQEYVGDETFCMTYGDGLSDVNISKLISFHKESNKWATMTAVQPPGRFGAVDFDKDSGTVNGFMEKPTGDGGYINGGFFVLEPKVFDLIDGDSTIWERHPMQSLAELRQIAAFQHNGFWQAMDTLREKQQLEKIWEEGDAPWLQA